MKVPNISALSTEVWSLQRKLCHMVQSQPRKTDPSSLEFLYTEHLKYGIGKI